MGEGEGVKSRRIVPQMHLTCVHTQTDALIHSISLLLQCTFEPDGWCAMCICASCAEYMYGSRRTQKKVSTHKKKWLNSNRESTVRQVGTSHGTNIHTPVQFVHRKWHDIESKFDYENTKLIVLINYFSSSKGFKIG